MKLTTTVTTILAARNVLAGIIPVHNVPTEFIFNIPGTRGPGATLTFDLSDTNVTASSFGGTPPDNTTIHINWLADYAKGQSDNVAAALQSQLPDYIRTAKAAYAANSGPNNELVALSCDYNCCLAICAAIIWIPIIGLICRTFFSFLFSWPLSRFLPLPTCFLSRVYECLQILTKRSLANLVTQCIRADGTPFPPDSDGNEGEQP